VDRPASRPSLSSCMLAGLLLSGMFPAASGDAQAQAPRQGGSMNSQGGTAAAPAGADRRGMKLAAGAVQGAGQPGKEPSEAYRESIRQTVENRRQRRANRGQGTGDLRRAGEIVLWPMPPALIIRHTSEVHDEIESLFGLLRK
jgi:hypothetical protein